MIFGGMLSIQPENGKFRRGVGKVNIGETVYQLMKDEPDFSFESRGNIVVKGKREMKMYFVSKKEVA